VSRTAAQVLAQRLYDAGCRFAFGIPGGEVLALMNALDDAGVRFVLTRHETSAGFMAQGVAHVHGVPGVLLATVGPGVANTVNAVVSALQDRVPLIVLTGCHDGNQTASYTHQIFDHQAVLRPITKASFRLDSGNAAVLIDKALRIAIQGRPGPVHIDVPIPVAKSVTTGPEPPALQAVAPMAPAMGPLLEAARSALQQARRPLLVVGIDVVNQDCAGDVRRFLTAHPMPVVSTYMGKGVVDECHPLSLGGAGLSPKADEILGRAVRAADVVVLAGYDPIEMRLGWRSPFATDATVIDIVAEPNAHDMHHSTYTFVGHIGEALKTLSWDDRVASDTSGDSVATAQTSSQADAGAEFGEIWQEPGSATLIADVSAAIEQQRRDARASDWGPAAAIMALADAIPDEAFVTVDTGAHRILLSQLWRCRLPRRLLQSTGLCTMACAVPLAAGAAAALDAPENTVVAVVGDGGLEMALGELATLRDNRLPVVVIVLDDRSLALIEMKQRQAGLRNLGVDFGPPTGADTDREKGEKGGFAGTDYVAIAEAFNGTGRRVRSAPELKRAIADAITGLRERTVSDEVKRSVAPGAPVQSGEPGAIAKSPPSFALIHVVLPGKAYDAVI